jgi:chloramphenicol-sensitive protein RarD
MGTNNMPSLSRNGLWALILAYTSWGLFPLYWHGFSNIGALALGMIRIVASALTLYIFLVVSRLRKKNEFKRFPKLSVKQYLLSLASALAIGGNWFLFIWAINHGHVVATSMAYYLSPLMSAAAGIMIFREPSTAQQKIALSFATVGVLLLAPAGLQSLSITLALAGTFVLYGLVRKASLIAPIHGLTLECSILAILVLLYLSLGNFDEIWFSETTLKESSLGMYLWFASTGVFTILPLAAFIHGVQRVPLIAVGLGQYIAPTMQFLLGVYYFQEPVNSSSWAGLAIIWLGILIYLAELTRGSRLAP